MLLLEPSAAATIQTPGRVKGPIAQGSVAVVQVSGAMMYGGEGLSHQAVKAAIKEAMRQADNVVLDIDSPGGTATGTMELATWLRQQETPIFTYTSGLMASAAYWLGSHSSFVGASPSSIVGSIGSVVFVEDVSALLERVGIKVHVVASGKNKALLNPMIPFSDDARAAVQARVDEVADGFKQTVLSMRPKADLKKMDGRTFTGTTAYKEGLVDVIANDLEDFIKLITQT